MRDNLNYDIVILKLIDEEIQYQKCVVFIIRIL